MLLHLDSRARGTARPGLKICGFPEVISFPPAARRPFILHHGHALPTALQSHPVIHAAATTTPLFPRSQFLLGFLAGGLVCSTAVVAVLAFFYLGAQNFKRILEFRRTVFRHVWGIFWLGLEAARATLLMDDQWKWKEAWTVLKENMREAKRAAKEGVEAIRLEAGLYAATVGKPGLAALQYTVDHLTPKFLAKTIEESLEQSLGEIRDQNIEKVELTSFSLGGKAPELLDARAYELGQDAMAFDLDMKWRSELEATMMVQTNRIKMSVPLSIQNVNFDGVIRVVLSPLTPDPPGFGAALLSLPATPNIGLDVKMAGGEITRMPWLRAEILSTLQKGIEDQFLWPRRVVIPSPRPPRNKKRIKTLLSKRELKALEMDDPLLQAERRLAQDLDSLHHMVPPRQHQPEMDNALHTNESMQMEIKVKDSDCLEGLEDAEEDLCVIDWDSFEVASSVQGPETTTQHGESQTVVKKKSFVQILQAPFLHFFFST